MQIKATYACKMYLKLQRVWYSCNLFWRSL